MGQSCLLVRNQYNALGQQCMMGIRFTHTDPLQYSPIHAARNVFQLFPHTVRNTRRRRHEQARFDVVHHFVLVRSFDDVCLLCKVHRGVSTRVRNGVQAWKKRSASEHGLHGVLGVGRLSSAPV